MNSRWVAMGCAVAFLAGCGGGGGSGTPGDPDPGGSSGLVPPAANLGTVLHQRATTLRPVIFGAQWQYRFNDYADLGPGTYTTTATRAITNGVTEVDSDDPSSPASITVDAATGSVRIAASLEITTGAPVLRIDGFELRSPVQVNDQWVLLDERIEDSGLDVDGDNVADRLDIALYRVVIGAESITLPEADAPVDTVRVDTFSRTRFTPSGGGAAQTATLRQSSWYAQDVGVVRSATHATGGTRAYDAETWLTGFDGVTRGWGAVVRPSQRLPGSGSGTGHASDAAQVPDGIVATTAFHVVMLDLNGRIVSAKTFAEAGLESSGSLAATSAGLRLVVTSDPNDIRITRLTNDGTRIGTGPVGRIDLSALNDFTAFVQLSAFTWEPGGDRFWMVWRRTTTTAGTSRDELLARSFDADGQAVSAEIALASLNSVGTTIIARATPTSGLLVTWTESSSSGTANAQTRLDRDGRTQWTSRQTSTAGPGPCCLFPWSDATGTWLTWRGLETSGTGTDEAYGVRLDASGRFVGVATNDAAFASERLTVVDAGLGAKLPQRMAVREGRIHTTATVFGAPYADDARAFNHLVYAEFDLGTGAMASGMRQSRRLVLGGLVSEPLVRPFVLDDRILLLTDDGVTLKPAIVWR